MTKDNKIVFHVEKREVSGKKVKQLRAQGELPANLIGMSQESEALTIPTRMLEKHLETEGESGLFYLAIGEAKKEVPVLIEEIQYTPVGNDLVHAVFRRVNLKEKVTAEIPVETEGEFDVVGAALVVVKDALEVEALPTDLPERFVIDVSQLTEIGQSITVNDLEFDREKVTLVLTEEERENPLVLVQELREEKEEEPEVVEAEGEVAETETEEAPAETEG